MENEEPKTLDLLWFYSMLYLAIQIDVEIKDSEVSPALVKLKNDARATIDKLIGAPYNTIFHYVEMICCGELRHYNRYVETTEASSMLRNLQSAGIYGWNSASRASVYTHFKVGNLDTPKIIRLATDAFVIPGAFSRGYGGESWAQLARLIVRVYDGEIDKLTFLDCLASIKHNGGVLFDKSVGTIKWTSEDFTTQTLLDAKRDAKHPRFLILALMLLFSLTPIQMPIDVKLLAKRAINLIPVPPGKPLNHLKELLKLIRRYDEHKCTCNFCRDNRDRRAWEIDTIKLLLVDYESQTTSIVLKTLKSAVDRFEKSVAKDKEDAETKKKAKLVAPNDEPTTHVDVAEADLVGSTGITGPTEDEVKKLPTTKKTKNSNQLILTYDVKTTVGSSQIFTAKTSTDWYDETLIDPIKTKKRKVENVNA